MWLFKTKQKRIIGPNILKRKILNGTSWFTETVKNKKISALISKMAKLIDCTGSFNIQLRLSKGSNSIRIQSWFQELRPLNLTLVSMSQRCLSKIII